MALDTTLSSHVDVPSDNEAVLLPNADLLLFKKGSGPGSYYFFESNPNTKLFKAKATACLNTMKYLDQEHLSAYLDNTIPDAFQHEAAKNGITLVQLVEILREKLAAIQKAPSSSAATLDEKMLAAMIATIAPSISPEELVEKFKTLCETHMDAALEHLIDCEKKNGRSEKTNHILLRAQQRTGSDTSNYEGVSHA